MAVIKMELSNYENTPVYFHTSADIVFYSSLKSKQEGLEAKTVQLAIEGVNQRVNDMITLMEDYNNKVSEAKSLCNKVTTMLSNMTTHFTQSTYIKPEFFEEIKGSSGVYYQAVLKLAAVQSTDIVIINPVQHHDPVNARKQLEAYNCISNLIIGNGTITLTCYEMKPLMGIPVQIVVLRKKGDDPLGNT